MMQAWRTFWSKVSCGPRERQALAFLRIAIGLFFLYQGHQKLINPGFASDLGHLLTDWARQNPFHVYKLFLEQVAIPNSQLLGKLVTYGEIGVGLSFVSGFLVRFSAPAAILMNLNFLLAGQHTDSSLLTINLAFMVGSLAVFWGRASQYFAFDQYMAASGKASSGGSFTPKASKKLASVTDALEKNNKNKNKTKSKPKKSKSKAKSKTKPF